MSSGKLALAMSVCCALGCASNDPSQPTDASSGFVLDPTRLALENGADADFFGYAVAASDTTALVGAPRRALGDHLEQGAAYVFVKDGDGWQLQAELDADDGAAGDHFGISVAVAGNTAVIGAPGHTVDDKPFQGAAYIFERDGDRWSQRGKALSGSDASAADAFGSAVGVAETDDAANAVVGAPYHDVDGHSDQGAAYVFSRDGEEWSQRGGALIADNGLAGEVFGSAVAISGSTALVGAPVHQVGPNPYQGGVYVFVEDAGAWTQQGGELTASDGGAFDQLSPCAIAGDVALLGAPFHVVDNHPMRGAAYLFERRDGSWQQRARLVAKSGADHDQFGRAVALSNDALLVAAPERKSDHGGPGGAVYFFAPDASGAWLERSPLWTASEGAANEAFGPPVALTATSGLVGSPYRSVGQNSAQGVVFTFSAVAD